MKTVKVPSAFRLLCGGAIAFWLSHIINPAFVSVAVMIVLFIPVFTEDYFSIQHKELTIKDIEKIIPSEEPVNLAMLPHIQQGKPILGR